MLFSAMLGTGWQLLLLVFAVIVYAMAGKNADDTGSNRIYCMFARITITFLGTNRLIVFYFILYVIFMLHIESSLLR